VNTEKIKYVVMFHHQNAGQNHNVLTANKSFENVTKFKHLGITVTNQNCFYKEIKRRLNLGSACHNSVQNLLSSHLMLKQRLKYNFTYFLYGCESWSLRVREEYRLGKFEKRMLNRIFGPKRLKVAGGWRKLHNEELHNLYTSPDIIRVIK
jgi:hypothetical protein